MQTTDMEKTKGAGANPPMAPAPSALPLSERDSRSDVGLCGDLLLRECRHDSASVENVTGALFIKFLFVRDFTKSLLMFTPMPPSHGCGRWQPELLWSPFPEIRYSSVHPTPPQLYRQVR